MAAHRKDFSNAVEMYQLGASVEDVADAHGITRQAMWKALVRRHVVMRPQIRTGGENHFFLHGLGYGEEKVAAKIEVMKAVRSGRLVRKPCEQCCEMPVGIDGRSLVHAHHADYGQPLQVRWLCVSCHFREHHT